MGPFNALAPSLQLPGVADIRTAIRPRRVTLAEIQRRLSLDELFLLAYVPYVIAEVAWDYADSCANLAATIKSPETKRLNRTIRQLRDDYVSERRGFVDAEHRQTETDNMLAFQEDYGDYFNLLQLEIRGRVLRDHPDLALDARMLVESAYCCAVVLRALFRYTAKVEADTARRLGVPSIGSVVPPQLRKLDHLVLLYAGDCAIGDGSFPKSLEPFVATLATYLSQSEISPTKRTQ